MIFIVPMKLINCAQRLKNICSISSIKQRVHLCTQPKIKWISASKIKDCITNYRIHPKQTYMQLHSNEIKNGISFESHVVKLIKNKVRDSEFTIICQNMHRFNQRLFEYEKETKIAIDKGIPIIYHPILMNHASPDNLLPNSYGIPDLFIRNDYLHKIISSCPSLDRSTRYYVIVDIKFSHLALYHGFDICDYDFVPSYKCQLYVYHHALKKIQGFDPKKAYIIGYQYSKENNIYSCLDQIGQINYDMIDQKYITKTMFALEQIKKLINS